MYLHYYNLENNATVEKKTQGEKALENPGIDPGTPHMLSERSTIWASPPIGGRLLYCVEIIVRKVFFFFFIWPEMYI